ncbi:MAG TPA: hypothetical protein VGH74_20880, partial [Planctomycetaceae bacterium]
MLVGSPGSSRSHDISPAARYSHAGSTPRSSSNFSTRDWKPALLNSRFSVVIYAGLGAEAPWRRSR